MTRQDIIIDIFKGLRREGYSVEDACKGLAMVGVESHELPAAVFVSELHDTEYQQYFRRGEMAGQDAQRVMSETDLSITRIQVTRVAHDLESAWYDAAYAKGFLKGSEAASCPDMAKRPEPPARDSSAGVVERLMQG